jgi:polysaccharide biosynthesis/export protein
MYPIQRSCAIRSARAKISTLACWILFLLGPYIAPAQQTNNPPQTVAPSAVNDTSLRDGNYVLQRGDEIAIKAYEHGDLDETVRIRPDGKISVQLASDVPAAGMTPSELSQTLSDVYAKFVKEPRISIIVRNFAAQRIYVGGEVLQPGVLPMSGEITVLGAIMQAGGFRPTARKDNILLLRDNGAGGKNVQFLNVKKLLSTGGSDIKLQAFDVVYVPQSKIAKVDQFVDQYIRQVIPGNLNAGFTYLLGSTAVLAPK